MRLICCWQGKRCRYDTASKRSVLPPSYEAMLRSARTRCVAVEGLEELCNSSQLHGDKSPNRAMAPTLPLMAFLIASLSTVSTSPCSTAECHVGWAERAERQGSHQTDSGHVAGMPANLAKPAIAPHFASCMLLTQRSPMTCSSNMSAAAIRPQRQTAPSSVRPRVAISACPALPAPHPAAHLIDDLVHHQAHAGVLLHEQASRRRLAHDVLQRLDDAAQHLHHCARGQLAQQTYNF